MPLIQWLTNLYVSIETEQVCTSLTDNDVTAKQSSPIETELNTVRVGCDMIDNDIQVRLEKC